MPDGLQQFFDKITPSTTGGLPASVRVWVAHPGQEPLANIGGDIPHDPASLTKLMNLYLDLRAGDAMPAIIPITSGAMRYHLNKHEALNLHDTLTRDDSLTAMMVASDNVAATANAIALGHGRNDQEKHRDFVLRMNATALELGMKNTHFANASGWGPFDKKRDPVDQPAQTTASDMALLIAAIYRDYPQAAKHYLENESVTYKKVEHTAHHGLNDPTAASYAKEDGLSLGAKTGFTRKAMYNIATMATAQDGDQLVVVLLGMPPTTRGKALTIVEKEDLPKPPAKPTSSAKQNKEGIRGDNFRDAVTKRIISLWHHLQHQEPAVHPQEALSICLHDVPTSPKIALAATPAASDASLLASLNLPLLNGTIFHAADAASAPTASSILPSFTENKCKTR